uniref:Uncharacterized protein n=1 Tax=Anguilla anguilla TaxID=7936 RepID=A0A0E9PPT1_ANGAN
MISYAQKHFFLHVYINNIKNFHTKKRDTIIIQAFKLHYFSCSAVP